MKKNVTLKIAASTLVLGLTVVGCKPASSNYRPTAVSAKVAKDEAKAGKIAAQAQAIAQKGDFTNALRLAEQAVELSPRDAGYRMLLGDLYLKSGRFASAETTFNDVLSLDGGNTRATLSIALAQIAQGKSGEAVNHLNQVTNIAPADAGLAYALAGQPQRAIDLLEPVARSAGANGRVRQNLALAYAVAGEWQKARVTAAQDLSPIEVDQRMQEWAAFTNPTAASLQVATLLGTRPVQDAGQPVRLALAPAAPEQPVYAEAEVVTPDPQPAPVVVAEATVPAPAEPAIAVAEQTAGQTFEAPVAVAAVDVPASPMAEPAKTISGAEFAAAVTTLVEAPAPIFKASAPIAPAPVRAFVPQKAAKKQEGLGRFVVQIGAYRSKNQVEKAWAQAIRRYRFAREPMSTTVKIPGKGTFHRLAIAGFQTPAEAAQRCGEIRVQGGACFVRANAGDAPVQWASRYSGRRA